MKILLIDHARKHFRKQDAGRWHYLPSFFKKHGHKVLHITKQQWIKFLPAYLRFKPDIILFTGFAGVLPIILKKFRIVKCPIVHDWNDFYAEIHGPRIGIAKANFLEGVVVQYSDFITTPSKYLAEKGQLYGRKVEFIPHGVNLDLKKKPIKLQGKCKVLYIGEQTFYKRVDRIIKAVKGLNCKLYLLGTPNKDLQKIAPKNAHFLGKVPHEEIGAYLKAVDICVSTGDQENLKLHEFTRAGKTVLAYRGRIAYALTHLENAYICEDLRKGLIKLMNNPKLRKKLEKNIKELPTFSWKGVANLYLSFLEKIIKKRK